MNLKFGKIQLFLLLLFVMIFTLSANSEIVRVALFDAPGYCDTSTNPPTGYEIDFLDEIAKYTQWTYEYYPTTLQEGLEMVKNGELDLIGWLDYSKERDEFLNYADLSSGTSFTTLFTRDDSKLIPYDYSSYNNLEVGFVKKTNTINLFNNFSELNNFSVKAVYYDTFEEVINSVLAGEIEAGVISNYQFDTGTRPIAKIDPTPFYFTTTPFDTILLDQLNLAQKLIAENKPNFQTELATKYNKTKTDDIIVLDADIQEYLNNHNDITIVYVNNSSPLVMENKKEFSGYLIDIANIIEKNSRLKFNYEGVSTIEEAISEVKSGKADALLNFSNKDPRLEQNCLIATNPYFSLPIIEVNNPQNKSNDLSYAIPDSIPLNLIEGEGFSNITIFPSNLECFEALSEKAITSCFIDNYSASYLKNHLNYSNFNILNISEKNIDVSFALSCEAPKALFSILNQSIDLISDKAITQIIRTNNNNLIKDNLSSRFTPMLQSVLPLLILLMLTLAILVFTIVHIFRLKRENKQEIERLLIYLLNTNEQVIEINFASNKSLYYKVEKGKLKTIGINEDANKIFSEVLRNNESSVSKRTLTRQFLDNLIENQKCIDFEGKEKIADNLEVWYKYHIFGIAPSLKRPSNIIIVKQNINKYKLSETQILKKLAENKKKMYQISENRKDSLFFLATQIQVPIEKLLNCLQETRPKLEGKIDFQNSLNTCNLSVQHLQYIIERMEELSNFEFNKVKLSNSEFNLKNLALDLHQEIGAELAAKHLNYKVNIDTDIETKLFISDPQRLKELLILLLNNAVSFTPFGGSIELNFKLIKPGVNQTIINFSVKDDGIGISKPFLEKIFLPFEKEDPAGKGINDGIGLGLTIAQKIVELLGGRIEIESQKLKGSVFSFKIPLVNSINKFQNKNIKDKENQDEVPSLNFNFDGQNILLVEDNKMNQDIAAAILRHFNLKVETASNGQEALDKFLQNEENTYALVLMDLRMPIMDGFEATEKIRNSSKSDALSLPIIAMTAETYSDISEKITNSGMNGYIFKPIKLNQFANILAEFLK